MSVVTRRLYRRLSLLLAASLLLHALVLEAVALHARRTPATPPAQAPLAVRLAGAQSAPHSTQDPATRSPAQPVDAQPVEARPEVAAPPATPAGSRTSPAGTAPASTSTAAAAPAPASPAAALMAAAAGLPLGEGQTARVRGDPPPHFRLDLPPAATIDYAVLYATPARRAAVPAGRAQLVWAPAQYAYAVSLVSDVPGAVPARSSGILGDDGITPVDAADGTHFDYDQGGTIRFAAGAPVPLMRGVQDRLSALIQLAGVAAAAPDRLETGVDMFVAGAGEAGVVRLVMVGEEEVSTEAGPVRAVHLAQEAAPGTTRMDLWLAPDWHWLPVKMQTTAPDGSTVIHLASRTAALR